VIDSVVEEMNAQLRRIRSRTRATAAAGTRSRAQALAEAGAAHAVCAASAGYLRGVDAESLVRWARRHASIVALEQTPGDCVVDGDVPMRVYGRSAAAGVEHHADELRGALPIGSRRTPERDVCAS
jgi:uncharacterized membrane protein